MYQRTKKAVSEREERFKLKGYCFHYCFHCDEKQAHLCPDRIAGETRCYERFKQREQNDQGCRDYYCQLANHTAIDCPVRKSRMVGLSSRKVQLTTIAKRDYWGKSGIISA